MLLRRSVKDDDLRGKQGDRQREKQGRREATAAKKKAAAKARAHKDKLVRKGREHERRIAQGNNWQRQPSSRGGGIVGPTQTSTTRGGTPLV